MQGKTGVKNQYYTSKAKKCVYKCRKVWYNNTGRVFIDDTGRANGRGAYLKKDIDVIKKCKKNKILDRRLEVEVPEGIYDELIKMI